MEHKIPVSGECYRHSNGAIYQVKIVAKDRETETAVVVYQEMFPPFQYWAMPLEEFLSSVECRQSSYAGQTMSLERIEPREQEMAADKETQRHSEQAESSAEPMQRRMVTENSTAIPADTENVDDALLVKALQSGQPEKYLSGRLTDQEIAERGCMKILDAETLQEKRQLMVGMKPYFDKRLLHNVAAALDIVLEESDLESQYDSLLHCLDTMTHFEGRRLR